jgi:sarcosine oxidase gamma subunit
VRRKPTVAGTAHGKGESSSELCDQALYAQTRAPAVDPVLGSITVLSHSRTCVWLDGPAARDVLAMGIAVDLSPDVFELNSFALTGLHHTPIMIHRSSATRYDLYALRTFALWTWEWLVDAALPFGYQISEARKPSTLPRSSANRPVHSS